MRFIHELIINPTSLTFTSLTARRAAAHQACQAVSHDAFGAIPMMHIKVDDRLPHHATSCDGRPFRAPPQFELNARAHRPQATHGDGVRQGA